MSHNHHRHGQPTGKANKLMAQAQALTALANVILSLNSLFHRKHEITKADELHTLRTEKMRKQNENEHLKTAINSNKIVEGDLKIELMQLRVNREKFAQNAAGITAPTFEANNYDDPGDIRHHVMPK